MGLFEPLNRWFKENGRDLPWRQIRTPYSTWISEVMLQQTQVSVVIPYFAQWMERFPTIEALATASWEEVVKVWEGLGYYSRAKNLHLGAQEVLTRFSGNLPDQLDALLSIKGIGPYTAGAILSFAFHKRAGAVDGNVARVLSRLFLVTDPVDVEKTRKGLQTTLEEHLPLTMPWIAQEALIELGALVCQKKAKCTDCPLQVNCKAFQAGIADTLPKKKNKIQVTRIYRHVAVIQSEDFLLVKQGTEGQVMGYLYEFPFLETTEGGLPLSDIEKQFSQHLNLPLQLIDSFDEVQHGFTRFSASLFPFLFSSDKLAVPSPYLWVKKEEIEKMPFSSGHKRILRKWQLSYT